MNHRIVITGGLGYIGTELCKLFSGISRVNEIIVVDNRFLSDRVRQLRDWGIHFVQGDILDEALMRSLLREANYVYHLAGITDVAYTKFDVNSDRDKKITEVGVNGTRVILKCIGQKTKIIFPSTHVVFEGIKRTILDLTEEDTVCPDLTYAVGKVQSENDIRQCSTNHVIVRLGSVYGYSTDTMRIGIVPNLFSKIASQDGEIKLFGGGEQYKSFVHVVDVARAMRYLGEDCYTGTFNISNEITTIKSLAEICREFNPNIRISRTEDAVPNSGYALSNRKLKTTGFTFYHNLRDSMKEMITKWSPRPLITLNERLFLGTDEVVDNRGKISNYHLTEPINLVGLIESKAGSVRANHYHPIQEQKCLLISGSYLSYTKDLLEKGSPTTCRLVTPGCLSVIQPNVAHAMVFLEDSVFLNLVNGDREHADYGKTHTIPWLLISKEVAKKLAETWGKGGKRES